MMGECMAVVMLLLLIGLGEPPGLFESNKFNEFCPECDELDELINSDVGDGLEDIPNNSC
jgi:hypothetical protein